MRDTRRIGFWLALAGAAALLSGMAAAKPAQNVGGVSPTVPGQGGQVNCAFTVAGCDTQPDPSQTPDPGGFNVNINTPPPISPCRRGSPCTIPASNSTSSASNQGSAASSTGSAWAPAGPTNSLQPH